MAMDTAMATNINMNRVIIDIHNHLMYKVDDGSKSIDMSIKMLEESQKQGIKAIFLTPHVNSSVSLSKREEHISKFNILKKIAINYDIKLYLGAEIYIPFKLPNLDFSKYTMSNKKILLIEFSTYNETPIIDHVFNLMKKGFKIIVAHVERYKYLSIDDVEELRHMGAFIQINSYSILNLSNSTYSKNAKKLLKNKLVDFIASDAHDLTRRKIMLDRTYKKLAKIVGNKVANDLMFNNQNRLLI